ncbi:MAG: hypothetical protein PVS2B3_00460 [Steroidobacteraceae bacterium]
MPANYAAKVLSLFLGALLSGCVGGQLAAAPAPGASLAGAWKLNPTTSDDPQKVIERMRAEATKRVGRQAQQVPTPPKDMRGGTRGGSARTDTQDSMQQESPEPGRHLDPLRHSQMMHVLAAALARGDFLTVKISPGQVVFDYGTSVRSFTPGVHSVVSAEGGVGDQVSGWNGHDYVITVRAQMGPDIAEHYSLSADGRHLIEKLRIGPAELPAINLTRVYDLTNEAAPRQLPTND